MREIGTGASEGAQRRNKSLPKTVREAVHTDWGRRTGSGIILPRFTSWLCCVTLGKPSCSWNVLGLKKEEFPRGSMPDDLGTTQFGEAQRGKGVLEANRTTTVLPVWEEGPSRRIGHVLGPPSPHPVISSGGIRNNWSQDATQKFCFICHFPCLFFLLSPVLPITFSFHEMRHWAYLWG